MHKQLTLWCELVCADRHVGFGREPTEKGQLILTMREYERIRVNGQVKSAFRGLGLGRRAECRCTKLGHLMTNSNRVTPQEEAQKLPSDEDTGPLHPMLNARKVVEIL
jgi:hypothetical protein